MNVEILKACQQSYSFTAHIHIANSNACQNLSDVGLFSSRHHDSVLRRWRIGCHGVAIEMMWGEWQGRDGRG
jgi:hypothetical protein